VERDALLIFLRFCALIYTGENRSTGIGVHDEPESVFTLPRNTQFGEPKGVEVTLSFASARLFGKII
ncbi:MAG TPA: hypothetical protein PLD20_24485, partial [Blastocatellia bacterium]|nr:hypothetical protein [Blastocatellia bacterium]